MSSFSNADWIALSPSDCKCMNCLCNETAESTQKGRRAGGGQGEEGGRRTKGGCTIETKRIVV